MKYKVGDKVKVREDLNAGKVCGVVTDMEKLKGKIVTISECETESLYKIEKFNYHWTDEMFEGLAEYTYEDLCKAPVGTKITFEDGTILVKNNLARAETISVWANYECYRSTIDLKYFKDEAFGKIIKIEEPQYTTVYEAKEILDEKEREYLSNVIKPFKDSILGIRKEKINIDEECITIFFEDAETNFPNFKKGTMYKGMKVDREYSLEELGLN